VALRYIPLLVALSATLCLVTPALAAPRHGVASPAKPAAMVDAKDLNEAFWADWKTVRSSDAFVKLRQQAGADDAVNGSIAGGRSAGVQAITDMAIRKPEDAARLISAAADRTAAREVQAALGTVVAMRAPPAIQQAAMKQLPPAERPQATAFTANLSTGIAGLPCMYLCESPTSERPSAPAGYTPVSGGSFGCAAR
jgi:hypothetical protein